MFASKRTLHNFKSSFATPKNYTFSCDQLGSLKVTAAEVLTGIYSFISEKPDADKKTPEFLSADRVIDIRMLPLGFHCQRKPNPAYACDFPGCRNREGTLDWFIMRGCNHSFHKECIKDITYCLLCQNHLADEIKKLIPAIKRGIQSGSTENNNSGKGEDPECGQCPSVQPMRGSIAASKVAEMRAQIHSMSPITQSSNPEIREKLARHCRTCKHAVNMHTRRKDQPPFCFLCKSRICNSAAKQLPSTCNIHFHRASRQLIAKILNFPSGLKEITLHDSQGSLNKALAGMGSNARTVISAITGSSS